MHATYTCSSPGRMFARTVNNVVPHTRERDKPGPPQHTPSNTCELYRQFKILSPDVD